MISKKISMMITILTGYFIIVGVFMARQGTADHPETPVCPDPHPDGYTVVGDIGRDAGGNCNLVRTNLVNDGKIEQMAVKSGKGHKHANISGRVIGDQARGFTTHDARIAKVTVAPGGFSRWHTHPSANYAYAISGKLSYWIVKANGKCSKYVLTPNPQLPGEVSGTVEMPLQVHAVENESTTEVAELGVIFLKKESVASYTDIAEQPDDPSCPVATTEHVSFNP
jgi:hypothetical protein